MDSVGKQYFVRYYMKKTLVQSIFPKGDDYGSIREDLKRGGSSANQRGAWYVSGPSVPMGWRRI